MYPFIKSSNISITVFHSEEAEAGPAAKKPRLDDNLEGGMADITRAKVMEASIHLVSGISKFRSGLSEQQFELTGPFDIHLSCCCCFV